MTDALAINPEEQTQNELNNIKLQLEEILHNFQQLKYNNFEYSNLKKATIPSIMNSASEIAQDPQEIKETVYNSIKPSLSQEQADALETPLSPQELSTALYPMPNDKSPGPDDFQLNYSCSTNISGTCITPLFFRLTTGKKREIHLHNPHTQEYSCNITFTKTKQRPNPS